MKRRWGGLVLAGLCWGAGAGGLRAESPAVELTAVARKIRASVMFLIVSDESGRAIATGTGFIVAGDGKLITNRHVANAGPRLSAKAPNGRQYPVRGVLAEDNDQDLVLLQVDGADLPALPLGDTDRVAVGSAVVMFGNPLNLEGTAMQGTVSGFQQFLGARRWLEITAPFARDPDELKPQIVHGDGLQVTTSVARGASGSPVCNASGEVLGVVTVGRTVAGQTTTLAIPVETVKALLARAARAPAPKPLGALAQRGSDDLSIDREFASAVQALRAGQFDEARTRAESVAARFPDSAPVHLLLGQIRLQQRSFKEAAASFERALQLQRDLAPAWAGVAVANAQQGLTDRARDAVRELQKRDPALAKKLAEAYPALAP